MGAVPDGRCRSSAARPGKLRTRPRNNHCAVRARKPVFSACAQWGEEFIVLAGVFEDDYGHWPEGSYIRNPPLSKHTPGSESGCIIFVKLWQFDPGDRTFIHAQRHKLGAIADRFRNGVLSSPLYKDQNEEVQFEQWLPGSLVTIDASGGCEILVLQGSFQQGGDSLRKHSWLRMPASGEFVVETGPEGAAVWVKSGHLKTL